MDTLQTIFYVYLGLGFVYAIYIWLFAGDSWYAIPVNVLGGPIIFIYHTIRSLMRKVPSAQGIFDGKKAIIFDLDGTIINSQPARNKAMEDVLDSIDAGWMSRSYPPGLNEVEKWKLILKKEKDIETDLSAEDLAERTRDTYLKLHTDMTTIDGFWSLLEYFKNEKKYKVGLATNSVRKVVDVVLERLELDGIFDFIITGDEVKKRKPHPEMYNKAAKSLGVSPSEVVVFEDTVVGASAAASAKMDVIVVWDGEDEDQSEYPKRAQLFITDFTNIIEAIENSYWDLLKQDAEELKAEQATT
jgi:HAD superfamily hydrolase (TIGR01509 family)